MELTLLPGTLRGAVAVPPSKSELHRALLCAALSPGETVIDCAAPSGDVAATARCLPALGASLAYRDGKYYVNSNTTPELPGAAGPAGAFSGPAQSGFAEPPALPALRCGESGSTLRFLLPVAAALGRGGVFFMDGSLSRRPVAPLTALLCRHGCAVSREGDALRLTGRLEPGAFAVDAAASSQFLSGLLLALPLLPGSSASPLGTLPSKNYVNLTCAVMARFGVAVSVREGSYTAAGAYRSPGAYRPEGDWSAAAFWLCANALGSRVALTGLDPDSPQGDRAFPGLGEEVRRGGAVLDLADVPDLLPPLAVLAALTLGETRFVNAARLRRKESDRLAAMAALLRGMGGDCRETAEGLLLRGVPSLRGGCAVDSFGDHRIAMAAAVAALRADGPVTLRGAEAVEKSYPAFWSDYRALGGKTI